MTDLADVDGFGICIQVYGWPGYRQLTCTLPPKGITSLAKPVLGFQEKSNFIHEKRLQLVVKETNEMVSLEDTAISLHILQPSQPKVKTPKCQDLSKFQFSGEGGCSGKSKPKVPRSVQFSIFGGGGMGCSEPNSRTGCSVQFGQKFLEA